MSIRAEYEKWAKHCAIKHLAFVSKVNIQECIEKALSANLDEHANRLTRALIISTSVLHEIIISRITKENIKSWLLHLRESRSIVSNIILDLAEKTSIEQSISGVENALIDELLYVSGNLYAAQLHLIELLYKIVAQEVFGNEKKSKNI